ncbi:DgyrCDS8363 [Dimorphilus gyrociliatus]|uniref:DgyrCDS8363 n=1 Tax=Dimorphilus gyrociliatus TaxID=2664684 RepID=A0A7I8VTU6_9ANNE|nr:DgyrCDS8363 [Dimorphilus gyrociliatus]
MQACFCRSSCNSLQEILLPPTLLERLGIEIGSPGKIIFNSVEFLGTLWSREDSASVICIHDLVRKSTNVHKLLTTPDETPIQESNLTVLKSVKITKISVRVVFKTIEDVLPYISVVGKQTLATRVRGILSDIYISAGYTIKAAELKISSLLSIQFIDILTCNAKSEESGIITQKTNILIDSIISEDQYLQLSKTKTKIGGLKTERYLLEDLVRLCKERDNFLPKTVLLKGPNGCGKTMLVEEVAKSSKSQLINTLASYLIGSHPGETEENICEIFQRSLKYSEYTVCILLIEDIDCLLIARDSQSRRFVSLIDSLMEKIRLTSNILCICTTSKANELVYLPKFDKEILIGIPRLEERISIIQSISESKGIHMNSDLQYWLAERTNGYSGADIQSILNSSITKGSLQEALNRSTPTSQKGSDVLTDSRPISWSQIGGLQEIKESLQQIIEWPIKFRDRFRNFGVKPPGGILLYGPPGCAKTLLVRAAATSANVTFLSLSAAQLYSPFVGDSEKKLSEVFHQARAGAPTILFIDEIDAIVGSRDAGSKQSAHERVLSTLLNELDGIGMKREQIQRSEESNSLERSVILVAATNRPNKVDKALLRPGRFDRLLYVPPPDYEARKSILEIHTKKMNCENVNIEFLAGMTELCTGADLENLCLEAALMCLTKEGSDADKVTLEYFEKALENARRSLTPKDIEFYKNLGQADKWASF